MWASHTAAILVGTLYLSRVTHCARARPETSHQQPGGWRCCRVAEPSHGPQNHWAGAHRQGQGTGRGGPGQDRMQWRSTGARSRAAAPSPLPLAATAWHSTGHGAALGAWSQPRAADQRLQPHFFINYFECTFCLLSVQPFLFYPLQATEHKKSCTAAGGAEQGWWDGPGLATGRALTR